MIVLDSGDKIRGDAAAASVVDYTIYGLDNSVLKQLADGQLADSTGDLYTADSLDVVTTLIIVNTDTSARAVNLFLLPSGGTARRIIPKDMSLGAGYSLHWSGDKISVMDASGQTVVTSSGSGISDVVDDTSPQLGGDLDVNGSSIVSVSDGDIAITPNGTGDLILDGLKWPQSDGSASQVLKTDGSAQLSWTSAASGTVDTSGTPEALDIARFTDADTIEGLSYSELKSALDLEIGTDVLAQQTIGIANDNLVEMDSADAASGEIARFTANGLESRSDAEMKTQLGYLTDVVDDTTPELGGNLAVGANTITGYTASRAIETDASGNIQASAVTTAELAYLDGAEAAVNVLAPQYQTIYIDAGAMVPCTTNGAEATTNEYGTNDIDMDLLAFDAGATEERAQFKIVMPENWDRSTVKVKFYWGNASGASASDTVEWGIKAGALGNDDAIDAALGTAVTISDTVIADGDLHISDATGALTIGGTPALGDLVEFEVYRNTDGTDDMAEDAHLFGVLIQYKVTQSISAW